MTDFVVWKEEWTTGIAVIDDQHRAMADQMNRIVAALEGAVPSDAPVAGVEGLLDEFVRLTRENFATEEDLMSDSAYPGYAVHKKEHAMLLAELAQLMREIGQGSSAVGLHTLRDLKRWFVSHVVLADMDYAKHVGVRE
jgi:hemerythrin-like metal-binding protein